MTETISPAASNEARAERHSPMPWATLIALSFATFATVTVEMLPSGLLPQIGRGLDVDPSAVGTLVAAWAVTIVLTAVPLVRLTKGVRRGYLIPAALGVVAAAVLVTAAAPTYEVALLARTISAAGHGLFWAVIVSYVAAIVPQDRIGRALAIVLAGPTIAGLIGLPLGTALADVAGWRVIFGGAAVVLALVATVLIWALSRVDETGDAVGDSGAESGSGWDRSAVPSTGTAFAGAFVLVGHFAVFTYVSPLITDVAEFESAAVAAMLAVFGAAGLVGVAVSGWMSDRLPRATLPASALSVLAAFVAVTVAPENPAVFVTALAAWGAALGLFPAAMQARVLRLASPRFRSTAGSVLIAVLNLGIAVGAALGGLVIGSGADNLAPAALVMVAVGAVGLLLLSHAPGGTAGNP